jgi:hypothetical protein
VRIAASSIDLAGRSILASDISAKVEGKIETGSLTDSTFSVVYSSGATAKSIGVDYSFASLEDTLAEGAWIERKLNRYNGGWFLANKVEVEIEGVVTKDWQTEFKGLTICSCIDA